MSYTSTAAIFELGPGQPYSSLEKLTWPFHAHVWTTLAILIALGFVSIFIINHCTYTTSVSIMDALRILNGMAILTPPKTALMKILIFLIMSQLCIVRNIYQGSLYSFLSQQKNKANAATIDEMLAQNFTFYAHPSSEFIIGKSSIANR